MIHAVYLLYGMVTLFRSFPDPMEYSGRLKFTPGGGTVRSLAADASKKDEILQAFAAIVTAKPVQAQRFGRPPANQKKADTPPKE